MSTRIKSRLPKQRDYEQMLKDYFGFHLYGLEVTETGGQVQAQVIYCDFKHIDTVRKELAQMMPEVEFTKLRRDFTMHAQGWVLLRLTTDDYKQYAPVIYVQHGDTLVKTTLQDIACSELRQLELDDEDEKEIRYDDYDRKERSDIELKQNAWE